MTVSTDFETGHQALPKANSMGSLPEGQPGKCWSNSAKHYYMKRVALPIVVGGLLTVMSIPLFGAGREAEWKSVEEAVRKGLPKTAITNLEVIAQAAMKEKAYPEAVKAVGRKIALEGTIQGNKPEERITRLEAAIGKAPGEMVPVLDTLLAHWYWHYFQQNRWRFMQRTATEQAPGKDFTTWDLPRIFARIDAQFQKALAAEKILRATPVGAWDGLLEKGTMSDAYRPTLYDFIAGEALTFYSSGEQAAVQPETASEPSAESPLLGPAREFLAWKPVPQPQPGADGTGFSPVLRAIELYQALLRFHQNDPAPQPALASADLDRLVWGWNVAVGEDKDKRYQAALEGFTQRFGDLDIAALAYADEARLLQAEGDLVAAHRLAKRGADLFPSSPGGKVCANLLAELEAKSATITTERVWAGMGQGAGLAPIAPVVRVAYRNVNAVYFKAIADDWEGAVGDPNSHPEFPSANRQREILSRTPALEWSEKLPPTTDYQEKTLVSRVPAKLKPGFYFIVASHDPGFTQRANVVSVAPVWVSDLALVTRQNGGGLDGFALEAITGEPLAGVTVSVWHTDTRGQRVADPALTTDENGHFTLKKAANGAYLLLARDSRGQAMGTPTDLGMYEWFHHQETAPAYQTVFFTDRAIYRPGQTIQYKGICLAVDQGKDNYRVLKGEHVTVLFRDANGKEIERQKREANDYGSFAGSFTAPRDRVMGRMGLVIEGRAQGTAMFNVEEYKRPKFQVTLDAPKIAPKLKATVRLSGHALGYTGAAVDNAQVRFQVEREARMPWWWGWWGGAWPGSESREIAHGAVRTAADGSFVIEFTAKPDPHVPEKDEPTFVFSVHADVTDSAGETRSADHAVNVGYTALTARMSADDWQTEDHAVEIKVETRTLDEEPQVAEGKVTVYALQAPATVQRPALSGGAIAPYGRFPAPSAGAADQPAENQSDPNHWPLGKALAETGFTTGTNGAVKVSFKLPSGEYRAMIETQDRFGKKVTGRLPLQVVKPTDTRLALKVPFLLASPKWQTQPGEEFLALWGTGYDSGRAYIEIEQRHQVIQHYWTKPGQTQQQLRLAVTEALRGGFTLHVTQVRENRAWLESRRVDVPWKNKELELTWEHFVSKLQPGQKETWSLAIKSPTSGPAEKVAAELVATLYDESLDAFAGHNWPARFGVFREDTSSVQAQFANTEQGFRQILGRWDPKVSPAAITYRAFPADLTVRVWGYGFARRYASFGGMAGGTAGAFNRNAHLEMDALSAPASPAPAAAAMMLGDNFSTLSGAVATKGLAAEGGPPPQEPPGARVPAGPKPDLNQVSARQNLNETAFFFPQLTSDTNGVVRLTFTMPEALTKWRFLGFAHDPSLRGGLLEGHAVTAKDLMVQPNPPRFLREADTVEFTVKISNQSDARQTGTVRLTFNDPVADPAVAPAGGAVFSPSKTDRSLANLSPEQPFVIPPKESRTCSWRIHVPDGCGFLTYKAVAATATVSDGEEGAIPVLSRRILVTESLPLPIRGPATKKFEFSKLLQSGSSKSLRNESLTVQMVSNPAWYAVLALPYLMEFPHECTEQTFNRLYADALARHIANSDPKIRRVFDLWKNTPALDSPLEKNQELKSVMIEETPWLRQAQSESQARRNVGILFDENRLDHELAANLQKLSDLQLADGSWPWFPGGPRCDYITLYITTGFGRLRHLGVDVPVTPALRSLARLDQWMAEEYRRIQDSPQPEAYVPSSTVALYLYGRSFFLKDAPVRAPQKPALEFFLKQARQFWLQTNCRQTQGHLALALHRFSALSNAADPTPSAILKSLKERSVANEEMGMFWRDTELSWWWYRAPIETQALMIEAFDEVAGDQAAVEDCRMWLLKQKQTRDWKTTKATADAVYALLLRGKDLLASQALVHVSLAGRDITPEPRFQSSPVTGQPSVEPGTGFYEVRFAPADIKPKLGAITVAKADSGVGWGSVHWQYLEDMSKVTPYAGTPLKLQKSLFTKTTTGRGQVLEPVKGPVKVGDELVVRLELRVDRDMEYIHLKDQRGSGTEPVNVLSHYKYQDGLAYYESTRDTASHFFIDYLPKGTYVFEYSTRVQLRGEYQTGIAEIQCMYAPEFNSHSESIPIVVK